jgi:hypothetical protein
MNWCASPAAAHKPDMPALPAVPPQVISDFGFGPWRKAADDFLATFEPTYVLKERRVGNPGVCGHLGVGRAGGWWVVGMHGCMHGWLGPAPASLGNLATAHRLSTTLLFTCPPPASSPPCLLARAAPCRHGEPCNGHALRERRCAACAAPVARAVPVARHGRQRQQPAAGGQRCRADIPGVREVGGSIRECVGRGGCWAGQRWVLLPTVQHTSKPAWYCFW